MEAVREHGQPLVDDPARLDGVEALGMDETSWLAANRHHHTLYVSGLVDGRRATPPQPRAAQSSHTAPEWAERYFAVRSVFSCASSHVRRAGRLRRWNICCVRRENMSDMANKRTFRIVVPVLLALWLLSAGAQAVATPAAIVAPPAASATGFVPSDVVINEGGSLSLTNLDTTSHNVACQQVDPVTLQPICSSPYANPQQTVATAGVAALPPGSYPMHCQLHPQMTATLTVLDGPAA
jgi:plastocyanin